MLAKFAVTNYRGFKERIEWDLSKPSNYSFNEFAVKDDIVKNGIIYGPNGSGKSNLGYALFDIVAHLNWSFSEEAIFNYAYGMSGNVKFEYLFKFDDYMARYEYTKDKLGNLIEESLYVDDKEIFYKTSYALRISSDFDVTDAIYKMLGRGENSISLINFLTGSYPLDANHVLLKIKDFANSMQFFRSLDQREFIGPIDGPKRIEEYIIENGLIDDFSQFLLDVSGQEFDFVKPSHGDKNIFCNVGDNRMLFLRLASTGTKNLELQYYWMKQMEKAKFVFIDEFDAFYHHELSYKLCKRLFDGTKQVYLTTHDTYLLTNDLLRPDCFFILNNNKIKSLADSTNKELRIGHNLEKLYRGGTFVV